MAKDKNKKTTLDEQLAKAIKNAQPKNSKEVNNLFKTGSTDAGVINKTTGPRVNSLPVVKTSDGNIKIDAPDESIAEFIKNEENRVGTVKHINRANEYKRDSMRIENNVRQRFGIGNANRPSYAKSPVSFSSKEELDAYINDSAKRAVTGLDLSKNMLSESARVYNQRKAQKEYEEYIKSPYYGKSYTELTTLRKGIDKDLHSGKLTAAQADDEKATIDLWRVRTASKEELAQMRKEAEEYSKHYSTEYTRAWDVAGDYARGNVAAEKAAADGESRKKYLKSKADSYKNLISAIDAQLKEYEIDENYDNNLIHRGRIALNSGASDEYVPTDAGDDYDYNAINRYFKNKSPDSGQLQLVGKKNYLYLEEGEIKLYNTLYNHNKEAAKEYLKSLEDVLSRRAANKSVEQAQKFGEEHPVLGGLASVGTNIVMGIPTAIDNAVEGAFGDVDTYDATSRTMRSSQAMRQSGSEYITKKHGKWAGFAYDTGLSIVENAANALLFKSVGGAAGVGAKTMSSMAAANMMGMAASNAMISAAERGGSDSQIILSGIANGAAEFVFEKISLGRLFDIKGVNGWKNVLKQIGAQALVEGSEEGLTEIANILSDAMIMQSQSENELKRREYVMQGMGADEATKKVFQESITQVVLSAAAGAISGGVMGGGATAISNVSHRSHMNSAGERMLKNPDAFNRMIQLGIENNNTEAVRAATQMMTDGVALNNVQAGKVIESVISDALAKKGDIADIVNIISILDSRSPDYIGSRESFDTARAVMHFVNESATEADTRLLERSQGAITLLTAIEGDTKAWNSVKSAAVKDAEYRASRGIDTPQVRNAEYGMRSDVRYKIAHTTENEPVVVIENDILEGVDKADWVKTAKEAIKKFRPSIPISGRFVKVTKETGREYTNSTYSKKLRNSDEAKYRDKLTAAGNLDEIVIASTQYVNEGLKHSRNDDIIEFARGNVLLQVGEKKYSAEVVIGTKTDGSTVLHDIVNINDKNFDIKKKTNPKPDTSENRVTSRQDSSSIDSISETDSAVNTQYMRESENYSAAEQLDIPEDSKIVNNIVVDEYSQRLKAQNPRAYSNIIRMARRLGMNVRFVKGLTNSKGKALDGLITSKGVFINADAKNPSRFVATHEFGHRMKQAAPKEWAAYQAYVINKLKRETFDGKRSKYEVQFEEKSKAYGKDKDADYINEEIAADYIGELFKNETELENFIREDKSLALKVRDWWYKILESMGLLSDKKKAQQMWLIAYTAAAKNVAEGKVGEYTDEKAKKSSNLHKSSDSGIVVKKEFTGGEKDGSKNTETLGADGPDQNNDSIWERSDDSKEVYKSLGGGKDTVRAGEENGRGFVDWGRGIQSYNLNSSREKEFAYGLLREISERRIKNIDAEGRKIPTSIQEFFAKTIFKDNTGALIPLFHATDGEFNVFEYGDFGFHVGNMQQAISLGKKYIKEVYVNITKPLYIPGDTMRWPGLAIANKTLEQNIISLDEYKAVSVLDGFLKNDVNSEANKTIKELLKQKGYNGIIYDNGHEGEGISAIAFDSNQIKYTSNTEPTSNDDLRYSIQGTRLSEIEERTKAQSEAENLKRENARLREQLENIHIQLEQAEGKGLDTKAIKKAAQDIRRAYGSKISVATLHQELTKLYTYMASNEVSGDEVASRISAIAKNVIENATETIDTGEYAELLDTIRNTRIAVPEDDKRSFADGYEFFRKKNMGKLNLVKDGYPLDALWDDLVEEYPHFFSDDIIGSEERLNRILEVRDYLRPVEENIYGTDDAFMQAQTALENDIMESFYNIPEGGEGKYVFYDKRAVVAEKALKKREEQFNEAISRLDREYKYKVEKAEEQRDRYRDRYSKDKLKRRIDSDYNYISKMVREPTDQRHVPEDMRAEVASLLDCFNFETVQLDRIRDEGKETESVTAVKLSKLHDEYSAIMKKAWNIDVNNTDNNLLDQYLNADLLELKESMPVNEEGEFKRLQDMTPDEMWAVSKMLKGIHHAITQRNKAFSSAIKDEISVLGEDSITEMDAIRKGRKGSGEKLDYNTNIINKVINKADKFFNLSNVQPWDLFHRFGGTLEKIYAAERSAFNKHIENIRTASKVIKDAVEGLNLKELTGKKADKQWVELDSGEKVRISKGQALSLYALYQRKQGQEHILNGGIVTNAEAKNSTGQKMSSKTAHAISEVDAGKIFETLSDEEKAAVKKIVEFMSKTCADWGNETSMKLYGYEKYGEGWYFPIKVAKDTLATYYGESGEGTLRSQSFTKKLVKKARNAVEIGDFFDIVTEHINGMSLYNTLALPMLDMERVLNYTQRIDGELPNSVRQEVIKTFGKDAEEYIRLFHKDVNGSRATDEKDDVIEGLMSNAKRASIGMNMRVLLQQPTSIARILLFVNPRDIPAVWNGVTLKKEMQEKMPIAYWKSRGFRDIGIGRSMKDVILDNESLYDKMAMGAYGAADDFTWSLIYGTVKNEIKRKNPSLEPDSAEFFEKVRERFDYIIDRSQVVDSVFHRTQNMRSGNAYTKTATMFMSEPLKTYNMYRTEMLDAIRNGNAGRKAARATAVFAVSNLLLALAQALPDTWREDDEKKLFDENGKEVPFIERYLKNTFENALDSSNPATYFPYIKDIVSLVQGFTAERMEYSNLSDLIASTKQLMNDKISLPQKFINIVKPASALFGISAGSLIRDIKGIGSTIYRGIGDEYADYMLVKLSWNVKNEDNKEKFMKHYKRALQNGSSGAAEMILQDYMAETFKGYDFKNEKMETVLGEMSKVYSETKETGALYSIPEQTFSYNGGEFEIKNGDFPEYVGKSYDRLWELAYELVTSEEYGKLTFEEKAEAFGDLKEYSQKAERQNHIEGYELEGWQEKLYNGEINYPDYVIERKGQREYNDTREEYLDKFELDASGFTSEEAAAMEGYMSDAATYYAQKEHMPDKEAERHFTVYDEKLSDSMELEEYLTHRAKAKKTAAMSDGKPNLKKDELVDYLESTDYSRAMKSALFEAIGNSNWNNPY